VLDRLEATLCAIARSCSDSSPREWLREARPCGGTRPHWIEYPGELNVASAMRTAIEIVLRRRHHHLPHRGDATREATAMIDEPAAGAINAATKLRHLQKYSINIKSVE
jgi:hypothetical protein